MNIKKRKLLTQIRKLRNRLKITLQMCQVGNQPVVLQFFKNDGISN